MVLQYLLAGNDALMQHPFQNIFYILLAAPFTVTSFTLNNILRYEGRAALGMVGLMVGAGLNILGDFILFFSDFLIK